MPLYEYQCEACGGRFEVIQKFSDPPVETCRTCGGSPVKRLLSSPAIQFKGTGWYITDYSQKGKSSGDSNGAGKGEKKEASSSDTETKSSSSDSASSGGDGASKPPTPPASS